MPHLVWRDVPVLVGQELLSQLLGVLEEVSLVPGPPQQVLDPLALPRVAPLAPRVIALGTVILLNMVQTQFYHIVSLTPLIHWKIFSVQNKIC